MKTSYYSALTAGLLVVGGSAWACDQMGTNVHVGNIVSIDRAHATFVIRDAQSRQPIEFVVASNDLDSLHVSDAVKVNYEKTNDGALRSIKATILGHIQGSSLAF
jgi:signal recognition particle receptor subunit beta